MDLDTKPSTDSIHLKDLLRRFPQLSTDVLQAVLESYDYNANKAFEVLCEMAIGSVDLDTTPEKTIPDTPGKHLPKMNKKRPKSKRGVSIPVHTTKSGYNPWITKGKNDGVTFADRMKVERMSSQYPWADKKYIEDLLVHYSGSTELVELQLLSMFPVDQIEAFTNFRETTVPTESDRKSMNSNGGTHRRKVIAEALRRADEKDIQHNFNKADENVLREEIEELKADINKHVSLRNQCYRMTSLTRDTKQRDEAKYHEKVIEEFSERLIELVMLLPDFKGDQLDLHGFSVNQALALVGKKVDQVMALKNCRRLTIITGRGKHSVNMKSILRPAVEKYVKDRQLRCSSNREDGKVVVTFRWQSNC